MKFLTGLLLCSALAAQSKIELRKLAETKASDYPLPSIDWFQSSGRIVAVDSAGMAFLVNPAGGIISKEKVVDVQSQVDVIFFAVGIHYKAHQVGFSVGNGVYTSKVASDKLKPEGPNAAITSIRNFFYHQARNQMWAFGPNWIKMLNEDFETMRDFTEIPAERGVVSGKVVVFPVAQESRKAVDLRRVWKRFWESILEQSAPVGLLRFLPVKDFASLTAA